MTDRARPARLVLAGALAALAVGCSDGPKVATVSGVVKVGGKEAEKGAVTFVPADGKGPTAGGEIGPGGRYTAQVPHGTMKVEISVPKVVGRRPIYGKDGPYMDVTDEAVPEKFNRQTELRLDVTGSTTKDWDVPAK